MKHFLTSISHMLLNFVLVWIGMTMVYKVDHVFGLFSWVTFGLSMFGRLVSVVVISVLVNLIPGNASDNIAVRDAVMLFCSGIRGPTALALVYQFPSSLREVPAPSIAQPIMGMQLVDSNPAVRPYAELYWRYAFLHPRHQHCLWRRHLGLGLPLSATISRQRVFQPDSLAYGVTDPCPWSTKRGSRLPPGGAEDGS